MANRIVLYLAELRKLIPHVDDLLALLSTPSVPEGVVTETGKQVLTNKEIEAKDMYLFMVALKLSRESYNHKEDNFLDCVAYLAALNNHEEIKNNL